MSKNISLKSQQLFVKRLVILVDAGVPLLQSLRMIQSQTAHKSYMFLVVNRLITVVENGQGLATGLDEYASSFGKWPISLVRVGESTGSLGTQLHVWHEYMTKQLVMRQQLITALVYPIFVLAIGAAVVTLLCVFVFPKLLPIFVSLKFRLPLSTRILFWLYYSFSHFWWVYLIGLCGMGVGIRLLHTQLQVRQYVARLCVAMPIVNSLFITLQLWRVFQCISGLLRAEMPLVTALRTTAQSTPHAQFSIALVVAADTVAGGQTLSSALSKQPKLFPEQAVQLIAFGEQTGSLSSTMAYVTQTLEQQVTEALRRMSVLFEPFLLVVVGLSVGFIALAIITPIYGITQSLYN